MKAQQFVKYEKKFTYAYPYNKIQTTFYDHFGKKNAMPRANFAQHATDILKITISLFFCHRNNISMKRLKDASLLTSRHHK